MRKSRRTSEVERAFLIWSLRLPVLTQRAIDLNLWIPWPRTEATTVPRKGSDHR